MPDFYEKVTFREVVNSDWPMLESWLDKDSAAYKKLQTEVVAGMTGDTQVRCFVILHNAAPIGLIVTRNTWNPAVPWSDSVTFQTLIAEGEYKTQDNHNWARAKFLNIEFEKHWDNAQKLKANA